MAPEKTRIRPLCAALAQRLPCYYLHTRAFWALALFAALGFMAQAGVSLHQVSHYIH